MWEKARTSAHSSTGLDPADEAPDPGAGAHRRFRAVGVGIGIDVALVVIGDAVVALVEHREDFRFDRQDAHLIQTDAGGLPGPIILRGVASRLKLPGFNQVGSPTSASRPAVFSAWRTPAVVRHTALSLKA
jgi:hypothetical protein